METKDTKSKKSSMSSNRTRKAQCTCVNEQQDALYGRGIRLWNHAPSKGAKPKRFRCTSCLREQEF